MDTPLLRTTDTNHQSLVPVYMHAIENTPQCGITDSLATLDSKTSLEFEVIIAKESQHSLWRAFSPKMGKYSRISPYRQQNRQVLTVDSQATPLASVSIGAWLPLTPLYKGQNLWSQWCPL